jgi:hypothetical protein
MALKKIKEVTLYVGLTENGAACFQAKKLLADNNIPHKLLAYNDISQHPSVFNALSTWRWGEDLETQTFTDFPIVHWKEVDDNAESVLRCVTSVAELNNSSLLLNKELVEE